MYLELITKKQEELKEISILSKIKNETDRIEVTAWLSRLAAEITDISNLSFDILSKNDKIYLLFKFSDYSANVCKGGIEVQTNLIETLNYVLSSINKGQNIIRALNEKLSNIQAENGTILSLEYRWGFGKNNTVAYWDYGSIVIKLNEESIKKLTYNKTLEECTQFLDELPNNFKWSDMVIDFLKEYNELELAKLLNSKLDYSSIDSALKDNMLSLEDIKGIVEKNAHEHGSQKLKSVHTVSELGLFVAVLLWNIDYDSKDISVDILENKVIDIENSRFISDHSLYSRIEQRILDDVTKVADSLKTLTS